MKSNAYLKASIITPAVILMLARSAAALDFALSFDDTFSNYPQARAGVEQAAAYWQLMLSDSVTVPIHVHVAPLFDLGFSAAVCYSNTQDVPYVQLRQALLADATSANDVLAIAHLPPGPTLAFRTWDPQGNSIVSAGQQYINQYLDVPRANARAIGLPVVQDGKPDADIHINQFFLDHNWFDYDRAGGIDGLDFVSAMSHEIGHALGFDSGVFYVDYFSLPKGPGAPDSIDDYSIASPLDLFRYTEQSKPLFDISPGGDPYFSLDGGATKLAPFATGEYNGNGDQASHWRGGQGLMDPVLSDDEIRLLSAVDRQAFDAIGWDLRSALAGDFNRDSKLTGDDVMSLLAALADLNAYTLAMGLNDAELRTTGDLDGDGQLTNADLQAMLTLLTSGSGSLTAVPEPSSYALVATGIAALVGGQVRYRNQRKFQFLWRQTCSISVARTN